MRGSGERAVTNAKQASVCFLTHRTGTPSAGARDGRRKRGQAGPQFKSRTGTVLSSRAEVGRSSVQEQKWDRHGRPRKAIAKALAPSGTANRGRIGGRRRGIGDYTIGSGGKEVKMGELAKTG